MIISPTLSSCAFSLRYDRIEDRTRLRQKWCVRVQERTSTWAPALLNTSGPTTRTSLTSMLTLVWSTIFTGRFVYQRTYYLWQNGKHRHRSLSCLRQFIRISWDKRNGIFVQDLHFVGWLISRQEKSWECLFSLSYPGLLVMLEMSCRWIQVEPGHIVTELRPWV